MLLAHELTHVVQQAGPRPGPLSPDPQGPVRRLPIPSFAKSAWYFEPYDYDGTTTHETVLSTLQRTNPGLLYEVPCPKGDVFGGKKGKADLYLPQPRDKVFGVYYGRERPRNKKEYKDYDEFLNLPHPRHLNRVQYGPQAPVYDPLHEKQQLTELANSPKEVFIGELKPEGERTLNGRSQIQEYIDGLNTTASEIQANNVRTGHNDPANPV